MSTRANNNFLSQHIIQAGVFQATITNDCTSKFKAWLSCQGYQQDVGALSCLGLYRTLSSLWSGWHWHPTQTDTLSEDKQHSELTGFAFSQNTCLSTQQRYFASCLTVYKLQLFVNTEQWNVRCSLTQSFPESPKNRLRGKYTGKCCYHCNYKFLLPLNSLKGSHSL